VGKLGMKCWPRYNATCEYTHHCYGILQLRQGSKLQWLQSLPESRVVHCEQCNVTVHPQRQHTGQKLLIITTLLHLDLKCRNKGGKRRETKSRCPHCSDSHSCNAGKTLLSTAVTVAVKTMVKPLGRGPRGHLAPLPTDQLCWASVLTGTATQHTCCAVTQDTPLERTRIVLLNSQWSMVRTPLAHPQAGCNSTDSTPPCCCCLIRV
jgi:hypothetical protein